MCDKKEKTLKKKYLCINCKKEFDKIPESRFNECENGYYHTFIKKSNIIKRK